MKKDKETEKAAKVQQRTIESHRWIGYRKILAMLIMFLCRLNLLFPEKIPPLNCMFMKQHQDAYNTFYITTNVSFYVAGEYLLQHH
jgi:hypothetical protein